MTLEPLDQDKLSSGWKLAPKVISKSRSFDPSPEALWLGPALLRRSVLVVFESVRKCYYSYKVHKLLPMVNLCLGDQLSFANAYLQKAMRKTFPAFAPKSRGRKRKRGSIGA